MKTVFVPLIGRLGNLLFIYAHARAWCEANDYQLAIPPWIGEKIFNIPDANRTPAEKCDIVWSENYYQNQESIIYTRKQVREWFSFRSDILDKLNGLDFNDEVILNVRQDEDYVRAGLVRVSRDSYTKSARQFGFSRKRIHWETDTMPTTHPAFIGFVSSSGLCTSAVGVPSFYRLMKAPILFRANSTFSWWAATLAQNQEVYSPVIKGLRGGAFNDDVPFVKGNWPVMADTNGNTDLHLPE